MKQILIAAAVVSCLSISLSASAADDYGAVVVKASAHQHDGACIHQMTYSLQTPPDTQSARDGADLAYTLSVVAVDDGAVLAVCDSCHSSIKPVERSSGIDKGISGTSLTKKKKGRGGYKSIPETSQAPFETGWRNSYSA